MPPAASAAIAGPAPSSREVWLISFGHALTHWYTATFYLLMPLIGKELGLSYAQIGFIMTAQHLVGAISNVPGGMVVDIVGRKGFLMATSLFWVGIPYALLGFAGSYWTVLACMVLVGIGNNIWHPTAIPTLAQRFPDRKALVLSYHGMGGNVGEACAPLVVGALLMVMTWRSAVIVNVIPGIVAAVLILAFLGALDLRGGKSALDRAGERQSVRSYLDGVRALLANRGIMLIALSGFFRTGTQSALLTFLPLYMAHHMGFSPLWVGAVMFGLQAAGFASAPVAGHLADRMGPRRIMLGSLSASAVLVFFMALAGRSLWFVFFVSGLGFFMYATRAVIQSWALEVTPRAMHGTAVGLLFGVQAGGSAVMPLAAGFIADAYGIWAAFYFLAATIVVANVFIFLMPKTPASASGA